MQAPSPSLPLVSRLAAALWAWNRRHWRFAVIAMLALLHVAASRGVADGWARSLLLAHLGLLLLWQPFVSGERRIGAVHAALLVLGAAAVSFWLDWWLLAFWVAVLAGLVGGKVFLDHAPWQRRYYLVVLAYLLALLAIVVLPEIAPRKEISPEIRAAAEYGLPALFVLLAAIPVEPESGEPAQAIDFFYSIFLILLLGVLILGSFTFMTLGGISYLEALTKTVFLIAATVLAAGLAWSPRGGYAGLNVFFSRHLFSIGLPVERWLDFLAGLSRTQAQPERFLAEAVAGLARLPWIAGAAWRAGAERGEFGDRTASAVEFRNDELALTVYSRHRLSPALAWHLRLLGQLLAEFYAARRREQKLQQARYLQAVHESGARTAHDVKNLLQALNALCAMAAREGGDSPQLQALIRRQLPAISERLAATLERLQRPQAESALEVPLGEWWEALERRYRGQDIAFALEGRTAGLVVPRSLFDGVADNLLQNALAKRSGGAPVRIVATLRGDGAAAELRVCDSGRAVPAQTARSLLQAPVKSAAGLGIGLYQAARHAEASGYRLALDSNRDGEVCFVLRPAA